MHGFASPHTRRRVAASCYGEPAPRLHPQDCVDCTRGFACSLKLCFTVQHRLDSWNADPLRLCELQHVTITRESDNTPDAKLPSKAEAGEPSKVRAQATDTNCSASWAKAHPTRPSPTAMETDLFSHKGLLNSMFCFASCISSRGGVVGNSKELACMLCPEQRVACAALCCKVRGNSRPGHF